ncbi:MAG: cell division protein FtsQ/DivIB, partial [Alphaproteobacteria bacterium]
MRSLIPMKNNAVVKMSRRRRPINLWRAATWTALLAPWALLIGLIAVGAGIVWSEGGPESFAARVKSEVLLASLRLGFEIDEVWVDGLQRADRTEVLTAIGAIRGEPIMEFDTDAARERLLALPWVKDAVVALALPAQVHVGLTEREPVALWQVDRKLSVIDSDGDIVKGVDPAGFGKLPILVGVAANKEAGALFALVAGVPSIASRMTAAVFVAERRWNIRIDDRIDVRLPAQAAAAALRRLVTLDKEHELLGRDIV